jgi:hypothetical protein
MEIELLVPIGQSVQPARARILELASELLGDKRDSIELSYQQMLIASKS